MTVHYEIEEKTNIIRTYVKGILTSADILEHVERLLADEALKDNFIEIVDLSEVVDVSITFSDLSKLKPIFSEWVKRGHSISIFYVPTPLGNEFKVFMSPIFQASGLNIQFCKTKENIEKTLKIIEG